MLLTFFCCIPTIAILDVQDEMEEEFQTPRTTPSEYEAVTPPVAVPSPSLIVSTSTTSMSTRRAVSSHSPNVSTPSSSSGNDNLAISDPYRYDTN